MTQPSVSQSLYDRDLNLWAETTVFQLQAQRFDEVDWQSVIEEIESLSKWDKREIRSRLQVLLGHLVKRQYVNSPEDFRGWEATIREQRSSLTQILEDSPSLKLYLLDNLDPVWQKALAEVREEYPGVEFPQECPFPSDVEILLRNKN
jgi:hypothetical protein